MAQQGFQATAAVPGLEAAQVAADKGSRVAGYLIDVLPAIVGHAYSREPHKFRGLASGGSRPASARA